MDEVGMTVGEMNYEWVEEKLVDFGCNVDQSCAEEVIQKLNLLATSYNIKNDDLMDGLIAHLLNSKRTAVTLDFLDDYETQLTAKSKTKPQCTSNASTSAYNALQRSILRELPINSVTSAEFDDNGDLDFDDESHCKDVKRQNVLGNIKLTYRGKQFSVSESDSNANNTILPSLRLISNCNMNSYLYSSANIMFDLNEIFDDQEDENALKIKEEADIHDTVEVMSVISGKIVPDEGRKLNLQNAVLYTNSRTIALDLDKVEQFAIFPGKKVKLRGSFSKNVFHVEEFIEAPPLSLAKLSRSIDFDFLRICVACGPFSMISNEETLVSNVFLNLLSHCVQTNVNALILIGPFIKKDHIFAGSETAEDIFNAHLHAISKFINSKNHSMRVFIVPSATNDLNSMPYFPTPPYESTKIMLEDNITLLPDPAIFDLESVCFAVSASEIITHLSKSEVYKSVNAENEDRMHRLFSHILSSRSLYPLCPSDASLPFSLKNSQEKILLTENPHVLILPSILQPVIKVVDNCVAFNPGKFIRGKSGGTFAMLTIDLKSMVNDSIAPCSAVNLLSNLIS